MISLPTSSSLVRALLLFAAATLSTSLLVSVAQGATYYVDSGAAGDDANPGTSSAAPWRSLAKVNSRTFYAGDQILLKRGGAWTGQLWPKGSGTASSAIVLDAYGTGELPIIDGGGLIPDQQGVVYLYNQEYWTIQNLEVTDGAADNGRFRSGIMITNTRGGLRSGFTVAFNSVHDVLGAVLDRGDSIDPHHYGGISFYASGSADSFANVTITENTVTRCNRVGIVFWDNSFQPRANASAGVVISQNVVSYSGGDNILLFGTNNGLIDHNVGAFATDSPALRVSNQYSAGIWPTRSYDSTVQYNESYATQYSGDGEGFDADVLQQGAIFQYNYSHDNAGGGILMMHDVTFQPGQPADTFDITVRDCIFQNENGWGVFAFTDLGTPLRTKIYNNTIYQDSHATAAIISNYTNQSYKVTGHSDIIFQNNIVHIMNGVPWYPPDSTGMYNANTIYGTHTAREPGGTNKSTADPLLVSPGSGQVGLNTVDGYKLRTGSPALGKGVLVRESYGPHHGNGGLDYWGNAVSPTTAPNRGAYNGPGIAGGVSGTSGTGLANPGFETGSLAPWQNSGQATVVQDNAHAGIYAAKIGNSYSGIAKNVTGLAGNTTYTLTAWIKNAQPGDVTYLGVKNYGGSEVNVNTTSAQYTELNISFTTGPAVTSALIYVWKNDGTAASYADDISLSSYIPNPGFETGQLAPWNTATHAVVVANNAYDGNYALQTGPSYSGADMVVTGLTPRTRYTLTAWVKNAAPGNLTFLGVKSYGGTETNLGTTATSYTLLTVTFTTGNNNTTADIYVWKNTGNAAAFADNFNLIEN
ncbi:MAG: carbohydrate binding domain-containing protein [Chthoniobacter sp.]|uniref:carbohydrate binding domain-containing protein n=1 Tax=Chthoniobacter sp. TaxID=2510640 RepID=UPI0032A82580